MSGGYQWDIFHRAVNGERIQEDLTPSRWPTASASSAMSRSEHSGQAEAV